MIIKNIKFISIIIGTILFILFLFFYGKIDFLYNKISKQCNKYLSREEYIGSGPIPYYVIDPIEKIESLSLADAKLIAKCRKGEVLNFYKLRSLSMPVAEALSKHDGSLNLKGINQVSLNTLITLVKHDGTLFLDGLTSISNNDAKVLSQHRGYLFLRGLRLVSEQQIEILLQHEDKMYIKIDLDSISPRLAYLLSQREEDYLELNSVKNISIEVADILASYKGNLYLTGLTSISKEVAGALAKHQGNLNLGGLNTISYETAKALVNHKRSLYLRGIDSSTLPDNVVAVLLQHIGEIDFKNTVKDKGKNIIREYNICERDPMACI